MFLPWFLWPFVEFLAWLALPPVIDTPLQGMASCRDGNPDLRGDRPRQKASGYG
jgi:hypothetical protein